MKRSPMTDAELVSHIQLLESQANNSTAGTTAAEQARAMDYYLQRPFGTEEEGRSRVISSDVWDVVEGLTPLVLKPFVSSDDIVRFNPEGPEDEDAAEQESDYINYVVTQKNDVFETLIAWVKTGLLQKNGIVKYWWDKSRRVRIERYDGLSDDEFAAMLADDSVSVVEHTEHAPEPAEIDPTTGQPMPAEATHDVVLRVTEEYGEPRYCVIPPEEFRISRAATSANPKAARFVEHVTRKTISEIREMGFDVEDGISDQGIDDPRMSEQYTARHSTDGDPFAALDGNDPTGREVVFREVHLLVDYDGDGMAELRRACIVGSTLLCNEEVEEIPYAGWSPYPQPFQFAGRCPADEAMETQLVKTAIIRQTMDNIYTINNNTRYVSSKVNMDDMLDNQIAGIVRVDGDVVSNHVMPGPITPIGAITMPMVEYFDRASETRTGFSRYNAGTDANSLNKTAHGIQIIKEAGDERAGLMARCFAEQGLKSLMLGIHGLCRRHGSKEETVRLRGKWVKIDPRGWRTRYDMSVSVGLGTADKQMQMQGAQLLIETQLKLANSGIVKPQNVYEAGAKLAQSIGEKNPDKYFTMPDEHPQPPPDPMQDPAFKLQIAELHLREREVTIKEQEAQTKALAATAAAATAEAEVALKAEAQGHDMQLEVMQAIQSVQTQVNEMNAAHEASETARQAQEEAKANEPAATPDPAHMERMDKLQAIVEGMAAKKKRVTRLTKMGDGQWQAEAADEEVPADVQSEPQGEPQELMQ